MGKRAQRFGTAAKLVGLGAAVAAMGGMGAAPAAATGGPPTYDVAIEQATVLVADTPSNGLVQVTVTCTNQDSVGSHSVLLATVRFDASQRSSGASGGGRSTIACDADGETTELALKVRRGTFEPGRVELTAYEIWLDGDGERHRAVFDRETRLRRVDALG